MMMGQWMRQRMMMPERPEQAELDKDLYRNQHGQPWGQQMRDWRHDYRQQGWGGQQGWGQQQPQNSSYQLGELMQRFPEQGMPGMRIPWNSQPGL